MAVEHIEEIGPEFQISLFQKSEVFVQRYIFIVSRTRSSVSEGPWRITELQWARHHKGRGVEVGFGRTGTSKTRMLAINAHPPRNSIPLRYEPVVLLSAPTM